MTMPDTEDNGLLCAIFRPGPRNRLIRDVNRAAGDTDEEGAV